jgi:hypothetical protein
MESVRAGSRKILKAALRKPVYLQAARWHIWRTLLCALGQKG